MIAWAFCRPVGLSWWEYNNVFELGANKWQADHFPRRDSKINYVTNLRIVLRRTNLAGRVCKKPALKRPASQL